MKGLLWIEKTQVKLLLVGVISFFNLLHDFHPFIPLFSSFQFWSMLNDEWSHLIFLICCNFAQFSFPYVKSQEILECCEKWLIFILFNFSSFSLKVWKKFANIKWRRLMSIMCIKQVSQVLENELDFQFSLLATCNNIN